MNAYGYGTMMNDYVFLEDIGRKKEEWGREIVKGSLMAGREQQRGGGRGRGRGRGGASSRKEQQTRTKRDVLKARLEEMAIDVDLVPLGMQRRNLNQSIFDLKRNIPLLTIEFNLHFPVNSVLPSKNADPTTQAQTYTLLTHRNALTPDSSLLSIIQAVLTEKSTRKDPPVPSWALELVCPNSEDPQGFVIPDFVMVAPLAVVTGQARGKAHYKLDPTAALSKALQGTQFIEFPTIEIHEEFKGLVVSSETQALNHSIAQDERGEPAAKRRKLDVRAGKKMTGLLGGYGSSEESDVEGEAHPEVVGSHGLDGLGVYDHSDDEEGEEGEGQEEVMDPEKLLELLKQVEGHPLAGTGTVDEEDGDGVDWGDSDLE
jgi:hypothetical protein